MPNKPADDDMRDEYNLAKMAIMPKGRFAMRNSSIAKTVTKVALKAPTNDFAYWQTQSPQARLDALEAIRREYHQDRHSAELKFHRVVTRRKLR